MSRSKLGTMLAILAAAAGFSAPAGSAQAQISGTIGGDIVTPVTDHCFLDNTPFMLRTSALPSVADEDRLAPRRCVGHGAAPTQILPTAPFAWRGRRPAAGRRALH